MKHLMEVSSLFCQTCANPLSIFWNTRLTAVFFFYVKICFFMTSNWALFTGCDCYLSAIELLIQVLYFFKAKKILDSKKMKAVCITWALTSSKSFLSCAFSFLGWSCYWEKYCLIWKVICIWLWLLGFGFR